MMSYAKFLPTARIIKNFNEISAWKLNLIKCAPKILDEKSENVGDVKGGMLLGLIDFIKAIS